MALKNKFLHFQTKASYAAELAKHTEDADLKQFQAYTAFVDEGPTIYVWGKEYKCDISKQEVEDLIADSSVPKEGTEGQVLVKTVDGTKWEDAPNLDIKIGGVNRLVGYSKLDSFGGYFWAKNGTPTIVEKDGISCIAFSKSGHGIYHNYQWNQDEVDSKMVVTVSVDVYAQNEGVYLYVGKESIGAKVYVPEINKWVRVSYTYPLSIHRVVVYAFAMTADVYIKNIKVEDGNKATAYSPAPEDKIDNPLTAGKAGQVLTLDADKKPQWATPATPSSSFTKDEADKLYQPKGDYITEDSATEQFQPKGNYQPEGDYLTPTDADKKYQPIGNYQTAGDYLTKTEASTQYQPIGDYAVNENLAINSAYNIVRNPYNNGISNNYSLYIPLSVPKLYSGDTISVIGTFETDNNNKCSVSIGDSLPKTTSDTQNISTTITLTKDVTNPSICIASGITKYLAVSNLMVIRGSNTRDVVWKPNTLDNIVSDSYYYGHNIVDMTTSDNAGRSLPLDKRLVVVNYSYTGRNNFELDLDWGGEDYRTQGFCPGRELHVIIKNNTNNTLVVMIPPHIFKTDMDDDFIEIKKEEYKEINILFVGNEFYVKTL